MMPPCVTNTLDGGNKMLSARVEIMELPYQYDHIMPFPINQNMQTDVDSGFNRVFDFAGD